MEKSRYSVFGEKATDLVTDTLPLEGSKYLAVEYLPGQFDQRASSAVDCVHLIEPGADIRIKSARLIIFDGSVSDETIERIQAVTPEQIAQAAAYLAADRLSSLTFQ